MRTRILLALALAPALLPPAGAPARAASIVVYHFTPTDPAGPLAEIAFTAPPATSATGWTAPPLSATGTSLADVASLRLFLPALDGGNWAGFFFDDQTALASDTGATLDAGSIFLTVTSDTKTDPRDFTRVIEALLVFGAGGAGVIEQLGRDGPIPYFNGAGTWSAGPLPEPASIVLLGAGLAAVAVLARRRRAG